jgi:hypothetical protein
MPILEYTLTTTSQAVSIIGVGTAAMGLVTAVISLILIVKGVQIIKEIQKELHLKGFDAICGFHARLVSSLKTLKRLCSAIPNKKQSLKSKEEHFSVFLWFCIREQRNNLLSQSDAFKEEYLTRFKAQAEKVFNLFNTSEGQIPLSEKHFSNLTKIYTELEVIVNHQKDDPINNILTPIMIVERHNEFENIIDEIINETEEKTKRLLSDFWKKLESPL